MTKSNKETSKKWYEYIAEAIRSHFIYVELAFIAAMIGLIGNGKIDWISGVWIFVALNIVIALFRIWVYWDLFYNTIQYVTLLIYKMQGRLNNDGQTKSNKKRNTVAKQTTKDV